MDLLKANWLADGNNVKVLVPISKVDEERRLVSGFASLNNVDQHDDVVTLEASIDAFTRFRGNIREMHQPIAAGRMLSFTTETYYDEESGGVYEGIFVTAYVSKGAQDTWEKVLDGTLSGFSIGGYVEDSHSEFIPDLGKTIRFITKMTLFELSLVDNPANQFANVFSVQKVGDELVAKGMATEIETQNVFWCETDRNARTSVEESADCIFCSSEMQNIGWIEVTDTASAPAELKKFMDNWSEKVITAQQIKEQTSESVEQNSEFATRENFGDNNTETAEKSEGGVEMSDVETVEKAAEVDEVVEAAPVDEVVEKAEEVEETTEEVVEKAEDAEVEEEVVEKAAEVAEETAEVEETVEKSVDLEELTKAVASIADTLVALTEKVNANAQTFEEVAETVKSVNNSVENVSGRLENLEKATAGKKSGNDEEFEPVTKELSWGGHFASASSIVN
jgi:hypothetical protein